MTAVILTTFSCFLLQFIGTGDTLKSLQIHVPSAIIAGSEAELICTYELEDAQLYSTRWYRNMIEFYRYVPKESPPTKVFPVADIKVDVSSSDANRVVLRSVDRSLTGEYQCEVSADAPLFHTDIRAAHMVVVEPPQNRPIVSADRLWYTGGDHIRVNCTAPASSPPSNITWQVNEQMVPGFSDNSAWNTSTNLLATSHATLELEAAPNSPVPTLRIRCEATILDVWRSSSTTLVLRARQNDPHAALGRSLTGSSSRICASFTPTIYLVFYIVIVFKSFINTIFR